MYNIETINGVVSQTNTIEEAAYLAEISSKENTELSYHVTQNKNRMDAIERLERFLNHFGAYELHVFCPKCYKKEKVALDKLNRYVDINRGKIFKSYTLISEYHFKKETRNSQKILVKNLTKLKVNDATEHMGNMECDNGCSLKKTVYVEIPEGY